MAPYGGLRGVKGVQCSVVLCQLGPKGVKGDLIGTCIIHWQGDNFFVLVRRLHFTKFQNLWGIMQE